MRRTRAWLQRLGGLFSRARRERDLAAELESHLALHIDDNLCAGMTPEAARRHALLKLGGLEQAKELYREQHGIPWLEHLLADFRYAARSLGRNRGSAAAIVLLLALGIGGVTALFGPLYSLVLSPLPYPHSDRIVRIGGNIPIFNVYTNKFLHRAALGAIFSSVAAYETTAGGPEPTVTPTPGGRPVSVRWTTITPEFFATLGVKPWLGRALTAKDAQPPVLAVLVSYRFWRDEMHGAKDVVGRPFQQATTVVVGVMPRGFDFPAGTDVWGPMLYSGSGLELLGRLRRGLSLDQAAGRLKGAGFKSGSGPNGNMGGRGPILETLHDFLLGNRKPLLWTLGAVSLLFLLLACAGAANLLLARGAQRQPEMVVRLTLGAGRGRLIRQLLAEALLPAAAGGLLGLGIAAGGRRWIGVLLPAARGASSVLLASLSLAILLAVAATIACGLAPAFHATGGDLNASLKTGTSGITRSMPRRRLFGSHELLAGAQLVVATVLLISTGLLLRSLVAHLRYPLGFDPRNVALVEPKPLPQLPALAQARQKYFREHNINPYHGLVGEAVAKLERAIKPERDAQNARNAQFYQEARERLARLPGVVSVAAMLYAPFTKSWSLDETVAVPKTFTPVLPAPHIQWVGAREVAASPDAFRVLGIHLLAGRTFTTADIDRKVQADEIIGASGRGKTGVAIVNEALAQAFWPHESPIGKTFFPFGVDTTVVGVAANVHENGENLKIVPTYYTPFVPTSGFEDFVVKLRPGASLEQFADAARHTLADLEPTVPPATVSSLQDLTTASQANLRLALALLACFSSLGTVVAALGVYAAATLMATSRTREMGIRIALGAHADQIRGLAVWRSVRLALVALPLGALGAWMLARGLSHWLFQVGAADPATYLASAGLLALIALAAGLIPARRAARIDPVVALREE